MRYQELLTLLLGYFCMGLTSRSTKGFTGLPANSLIFSPAPPRARFPRLPPYSCKQRVIPHNGVAGIAIINTSLQHFLGLLKLPLPQQQAGIGLPCPEGQWIAFQCGGIGARGERGPVAVGKIRVLVIEGRE